MLAHPHNLPLPGTVIMADKGLRRKGLRGQRRCHRPAPDQARPKDEPPLAFPGWLRQRAGAIIWTLKSQLGLGRHGGRVPAGL